MLDVGSDSKIYLCTGCTDMRKGINGLSILAQSILSDQFHKSTTLDPRTIKFLMEETNAIA
jgi:hypothetical protein